MKYDFIPIEGKPFAFQIVEKDTRQPVDVPAKIMAAFNAGAISKKD